MGGPASTPTPQLGAPPSGLILNTTNGGANWSSQTIGTNGLNAVAFVNTNDGWAVGQLGTILVTTNGGTSWSPQTSGTTASLDGVAFADVNDGWAVGSTGTILVTTNGGATWSPQTSGTSFGLHAIAVQPAPLAVPEPAALVQAGLGLSLVLGYAWRRGRGRTA